MPADQAPPLAQSPAERAAQKLSALLAHQNIPADVHPISGGEVAVSVYYGLIARTDGSCFWWTSPKLSRCGRPLLTYATTPATAATRLAEDYEIQHARPLTDLLRGPLLSHLLTGNADAAPL